MDKFDRIYRLHGLLANRRQPIPLTNIMAQLECSKATANRCIDDLRTHLNAPLVYDRDANGYHYDQHADKPYQLPGLWFSAEELNGLLICQQILNNISPGLLSQHISQLQQRIGELFKLHQHTPIDIANKITLLSTGRRLTDDSEFKKTATALFAGKQLHIHYRARADNTITQRDVSPQQLLYYRDNWYLVAHCHYRNALREFAIDNIRTAHILSHNAHSTEPEHLAQFIHASYGIFSGNAQHLAILEFSNTRAQWVADEHWHPQQQSLWLDNGNYQLSIPFNDSRELIMDILKHGPEVTVIAPAFLRTAVISHIDAMQKNYQHSPDNLTE